MMSEFREEKKSPNCLCLGVKDKRSTFAITFECNSRSHSHSQSLSIKRSK